jgi:hypothetical protein
MEPRTEEHASKDEDFDFWSFQAHERGATTDLNIWKEKGYLSKKQL